MAYKGKFTPKNPNKYKGNVQNIIWRSTWELRLLKWLDENSSVIEYASEEIIVPYTSPVDGKIHRYYIDFYVKVKTRTNEIKVYLIEVKPYIQTLPPKKKRNTKKYLQEINTYAVNLAKWEAAKKFAKNNNVEFLVLTEKTLFNK